MNEDNSNLELQLDRDTAIALRDAIYSLGEFQAAGAPIPFFDTAESEKLGECLKQLNELLRVPNSPL